MKRLITKILALLMAVVVLISTTSFTIDLRYCGEKLLDTTIFAIADSCDSETRELEAAHCCKPKENCCDDEQIVLEGLEDLTLNSITKLKISQQVLWLPLTFSDLSIHENTIVHDSSFNEYSPPLIVQNFQELHQVFLL